MSRNLTTPAKRWSHAVQRLTSQAEMAAPSSTCVVVVRLAGDAARCPNGPRTALCVTRDSASLGQLRGLRNENGIPGRRNRQWGRRAWGALLEPHELRQCAGCGVWSMRRRGRRQRCPDKWETVEDAHPAIVTLADATNIKRAREARSHLRPRTTGAQAGSNGSR
jgi:hypothetical protein